MHDRSISTALKPIVELTVAFIIDFARCNAVEDYRCIDSSHRQITKPDKGLNYVTHHLCFAKQYQDF